MEEPMLPVIRGIIDRRILVTCRAHPAVLSRLLPPPFRPKVIGGAGIAGVCLIRLQDVRPAGLPAAVGLTFENAAHRIAVEWDDPAGGPGREGAYISRRDTSSRLATLAGGRVFPGVHHHARFRVEETGDRFDVGFEADDGSARLRVTGRRSDRLPAGSCFADLDAAAKFYRRGSLGWSPTGRAGVYDGLELRTSGWRVEPVAVNRFESSVFEDPALFPPGSAELDSALLMRGLEHEWHSCGTLCCA
jgi:hypothetical protein